MPKVPSLTAEKVVRLLLQSGFELDHQAGSHRVYYNKITKKNCQEELYFQSLSMQV